MRLCVMMLSKPTNSHLSLGGVQQLRVFKVLTEVAKVSTHRLNYPDNFFK